MLIMEVSYLSCCEAVEKRESLSEICIETMVLAISILAGLTCLNDANTI